MIKKFKFFFTTILLLITFPLKSLALIEVDITRGNLNPLPVAVSSLSSTEGDKKNLEKATNIYNQLKKNNLDVIIDDSYENFSSKMKKFNLLGIPYQIIIGKNFNEKKIEFKEVDGEAKFVSLDEIINIIKNKKSN